MSLSEDKSGVLIEMHIHRLIPFVVSTGLLSVGTGCGNVSSSGGDGVVRPFTEVSRTLSYYYDNRVCMSEPDGAGAPTALEPHVPCTTDDVCIDPAYPSCRHLEEIKEEAELQALAIDITAPPTPVAGPMTTDYLIRYVPLCADGSGDHEHAIGSANGVSPTCAEDEFIRCTDGTRPHYFVNVADQASDDWLIWAGSGGYNLYAEFSGWRGMHQDRSSLGYAGAPPSTRAGLGGVFQNTSGTAFDNFNRVWVEKCTPDRWQGTATRTETNEPQLCDSAADLCTGTLEPPAHDPSREVDVFFHGHHIAAAVLTDLASAVDLVDEAGTVVDTAPALADANNVVFSCHSNGCNGMTHLLDERADQISQIAPAATTRAIFNNFFTAALEGEWAFDAASGTVFNNRSIYEHVSTGTSVAVDDDGIPYPISNTAFTTGEIARTHARYGAVFDASCVAFHGGAIAPCRDSMHVLANHLNHEFFYVMAQGDQSLLEGGGNKAPYCDGRAEFPYGCPFTGVELSVVSMIRKQLADIFLRGQLDRCEAGNGPAPYDTTAVWAPAWTEHAGMQDTEVATLVMGLPSLTPAPLYEFLALWIDIPLHHAFVQDIPFLDASARNQALGLEIPIVP